MKEFPQAKDESVKALKYKGFLRDYRLKSEDISVDEIVKSEENSAKDSEVLKLLSPKSFDIRNFHQDFQDNSQEALMRLLLMQDNEHPLKKGGEEIAYRCDILIMLNRQKFNAYENTLFDILCGYVSSKPQDNHYVIYPKDVKRLVSYTDPSYVYKLLKEATESILKKPLLFEITMPNGKKQNIAVPWYEILTYSDKNTNDEASFISFTPSKFFKMLLISASVTHGAFYRISVSSAIQSKYVRNLYYVLESRKNYKATPVAKPGEFRISLEDLQLLVGYPENYRATDIRRFILEAGKNEINALDGCDFVFDYELVKTASGAERKKYTHVDFAICGKEALLVENTPKEDKGKDKPADPNTEILKSMLLAVEMTENERKNVIERAIKYDRDITFVTQAIAKVLNSPSVRSKAAVLLHIMEHGLTAEIQNNAKEHSSYANINRSDYDFDELERLLVNNHSSTE